MEKETEEKISELQGIEQNLQRFLNQKQNFQTQIVEIETALKEIPDSDETYKILGNIMVSVKKENLKSELEDKKELITIKLKSIEKQEENLRKEADNLQQEIMKKMKK